MVKIAKAGMRIRASFGTCAARAAALAGFSDRKQTGLFVSSQFTFGRCAGLAWLVAFTTK
jgi:hypothetical protein